MAENCWLNRTSWLSCRLRVKTFSACVQTLTTPQADWRRDPVGEHDVHESDISTLKSAICFPPPPPLEALRVVCYGRGASHCGKLCSFPVYI